MFPEKYSPTTCGSALLDQMVLEVIAVGQPARADGVAVRVVAVRGQPVVRIVAEHAGRDCRIRGRLLRTVARRIVSVVNSPVIPRGVSRVTRWTKTIRNIVTTLAALVPDSTGENSSPGSGYLSYDRRN